MTPPVREFQLDGQHRLIPSLYSEAGTVLEDIADNPAMLADIVLLDGATNDRVQGERQGLAGISTFELVYGIPNARIVNAAFTHSSDTGSRFAGPGRGAWYAASELETSIAEVTYHKAKRLAEIVVPELPYKRPDKEISTYDDWLADFRASFHELDPPKRWAAFLRPEPVPRCYAASQRLAHRLIEHGSNGIVYLSVRRPAARCLACFRPALVYHPRPGDRLEITFTATPSGYDHSVRTVRSHRAAKSRGKSRRHP